MGNKIKPTEQKNNQIKFKQYKKEADFKNIRSKYIKKKIFKNLSKNISLNIIKYNKFFQNQLDINMNDYKECLEKYTKIEIELIPFKNKFGKFINITNKEKYFHIYFNDNEEEIKRFNLIDEDKVFKIKIIIDYQIISFHELFSNCECIKSLNFKKFKRNNINKMSLMFSGCSSLKEIIFTEFNTNNVNSMRGMFYGCSSLKELNLSNFNTENVLDMSDMFSGCSSLKVLDLSNFNTKRVNDMSMMFFECSELKSINISSFDTNNVRNMSYMFSSCSSLKESNISNFDVNKVKDMKGMLVGCSKRIENKVKSKIKNINKNAFNAYFVNYEKNLTFISKILIMNK